MSRRVWVVGTLVLALVLAAAAAVGLSKRGPECGAVVRSLSGARSSSPFLDAAGRKAQPDADRDRVVAALDRAGGPFGAVVGAVGYHYEQWATLSAYAQGLGVRTRDNPDFTLLDDRTLRPRWSVQVSTKRSAYDADGRTYLVATMPRTGSPDLVALDAGTGHRRWCATLGGPHVAADDPFATQLTSAGGVVVLGPGEGSEERLVRLRRDGSQRWERTLDADGGAFLGSPGEGLLLVGGREQYALFDQESLGKRPSGNTLVAIDAASGRTAWKLQAESGVDLHVLGVDNGLAIAQEWRAGASSGRLVAIDEEGSEAWQQQPADGSVFDATLRAGRVIVRAGSRWSAYDAGTGEKLWSRTMPSRPQFLPYGFELDSLPLLDDDHALLGTTTALRTLDLRSGAMTSVPLPTDGVSTTYWPYQVVVTDHLVGVATNTSAVVARRR